MIRRPPRSTLFPSTPLFRSLDRAQADFSGDFPPVDFTQPRVLVGHDGESARLRFIEQLRQDRKSTRLNSSHLVISYAVFCLKKKKKSQTAVHQYMKHSHPKW